MSIFKTAASGGRGLYCDKQATLFGLAGQAARVGLLYVVYTV